MKVFRMKSRLRPRGLLCLAAALSVISCSKEKVANADTMAELELAGHAAAPPQLNDVADTSKASVATRPAMVVQDAAPRKRAPAPAKRAVADEPAALPAPASEPAVVAAPMPVIASGTPLSLHVSAAICDNQAKVGDEILATLDQDVSASNNAQLPAGSIVALEIVQVGSPTDSATAQPFTFRTRTVRWDAASIPLQANVRSAQVERVKRPVNKANIVKGAIGGAVLGFLAGRSKKAIAEGATAGAAVGTGVSLARRDYDLCIPSGGLLTLSLTAPVTKAP
jgi:hypothetical protein